MDIQWHNERTKQKLKHILTKEKNERIQLFNATTKMCMERFMQRKKIIQIYLNYMVSDVKIISHMNEKLCIPHTIHRVAQCANCAYFGFLVSVQNVCVVDSFPIGLERNALCEISVGIFDAH